MRPARSVCTAPARETEPPSNETPPPTQTPQEFPAGLADAATARPRPLATGAKGRRPMIAQLREFANDPLAFFANLIIPTPAGPAVLAGCWPEFQQRDFEALAPSLKALARGKAPPC